MGSLTKQVSQTQEILLHRIASRIRQSLELQEILSATVAEVVEKHGGKLHCLSLPGEGAEFVIEIPVKQSEVKVVNLRGDTEGIYKADLYARSH